jgi:serine/threonine protein kinase
MLGRTISHYRITGHLGAGGMGVVYSGEDTRLGRSVALKFVPDDLADARALQRLRAEARAASALNHPNICTIYDVGEHEGRPYLVMELLKGHTLRDLLTVGPIKIHQTVDIGIQVADALDAAHAAGILHRDIKPANLLLVDRGVVKILDFGLAKHLIDEDSESPSRIMTPEPLTGEGVTVGTVAYMSPEQVTGEPLDGRTDLFSLGIVLYECTTGRRPFSGKTSAVILSAILNESPVAPAVFNPLIPARLQEVIANCLEKDRELRYQDAAGLRADLKRVRRDLESGPSNAAKALVRTATDDRGAQRGSVSSRGREESEPVPAAKPAAARAVALAALSLAAVVASWLWFRTPTPPPSSPGTVEVSPAAASEPSPPPEPSRVDLASASLQARQYRDALNHAREALRQAPNDPEARRIRDESAAVIERFDQAVARGHRLLGAGDPDGASDALRIAREIEPTSRAVSTLQEQIVSQYKALARQRPEASRTPPARTPASVPPAEDKPLPVPPPAEPLRQPVPAAAAPSAEPLKSEPVKPTPPPQLEPASAAPRPPAPGQTTVEASGPAKPAEPPPRAAAPSPAATPEPKPPPDDDVLITRLVEGWARAIENKDLAAYRALKPNMTATEQRRIEEGFRAVSSQRVEITILGIEKRGQQAVVRLRRRDTIVVDGRQQTQESQQTVTVVRAGSGWLIRDIGR